jgi:hypothetical protein
MGAMVVEGEAVGSGLEVASCIADSISAVAELSMRSKETWVESGSSPGLTARRSEGIPNHAAIVTIISKIGARMKTSLRGLFGWTSFMVRNAAAEDFSSRKKRRAFLSQDCSTFHPGMPTALSRL